MKRLLLDQGLPRSTVRLLVEAGWDVVHVAELAALLQRIWDGVEDAQRDGALVTVTDRSVRVRRLPVGG